MQEPGPPLLGWDERAGEGAEANFGVNLSDSLLERRRHKCIDLLNLGGDLERLLADPASGEAAVGVAGCAGCGGAERLAAGRREHARASRVADDAPRLQIACPWIAREADGDVDADDVCGCSQQVGERG